MISPRRRRTAAHRPRSNAVARCRGGRARPGRRSQCGAQDRSVPVKSGARPDAPVGSHSTQSLPPPRADPLVGVAPVPTALLVAPLVPPRPPPRDAAPVDDPPVAVVVAAAPAPIVAAFVVAPGAVV